MNVCDGRVQLTHVPHSEVTVVCAGCEEVFGEGVPADDVDIGGVSFEGDLSLSLAFSDVPDSDGFVY